MVASKKLPSRVKELVAAAFGEIVDFHALDRIVTREPSREISLVRYEDEYSISSWPTESAHWWDGFSRTWRRTNEPMSLPPYAEQVEHIELTFGPPDIGWMDCKFRSVKQVLKHRYSSVFDPFDDEFVPWLEAICVDEHARLAINTEGALAVFHVIPAGAGCVFVVGRAIYAGHADFIVNIPRRNFISDFYNAVITHWESATMTEKWTEWLFSLKDPDAWEDYGEQASGPWPIRSAKIERYLAEEAT